MSLKYFLAFDSNRVALIRKEKGQFFIEHLRNFEADVNPLYILKPILHGKSYEIVTGLKAQDVLLRSLHLKLKSQKEILAALPFQVEEILPFSSEEVILIPTIYPEKEGSKIYLLATSKSILQKHLEKNLELSLDPGSVSAVPLALFRFGRYLFPEKEAFFIYHEESGTFVVMKEKKLIAFQTLSKENFSRVVTYMQKNFPDIEEILSIGETPLQPPFNPLTIENREWIPYAIPIGLALDAASNDSQSGQFLFGETLSKKQVLRKKRRYIAYLTTCALFTALTFTSSYFYLKKSEYQYLEKIDSKTLSLREAVFDLEDIVSKKKKLTLPPTTIPRVHEVLLWLSTHPNLQTETSITHFRYQITKCPRLDNTIKNYGAKIDLEFTSESSKEAREFHESLLKNRDLIDSKQEIRFSSDHGIYRVIFHLKEASL